MQTKAQWLSLSLRAGKQAVRHAFNSVWCLVRAILAFKWGDK